jgi:hypothetical protein
MLRKCVVHVFEEDCMQPDAQLPLLQKLQPRKVAVFRALQLGDMLCAIPALRALRIALPHAHITLVGLPWAEQFAHRFPHYIDDFIAFPGHPAFPEQPVREGELESFYRTMRECRYDLAIQLHGSGATSNSVVAMFGAAAVAGYVPAVDRADGEAFPPYPETGTEPERLLHLMEFLGAPSLGINLEFPITAEDERELEESGVARGLEDENYICIHPGARRRDKCWPASCFAEVADTLAREFGVTIVLTGSAKEADLTGAVAEHMRMPAIDAAAPISIGAMAALMSRSKLLVCNDTGVSHIAAGLRLPSVVVFSLADIRRWAPLNQSLHRSLWDPEGWRVQEVLEHARILLADAEAGASLT